MRTRVARPWRGFEKRAQGGESIAELCDSAGLRLTPERLATASVFDAAEHPIDIEEARRWLGLRNICRARSTVYRLAVTLVRRGILIESGEGSERRRYIAVYKLKGAAQI